MSARVVVVGGGLAGIAAAIACADGGASVTLLEARKWLGGATASFERDGLVLDTGQHVFLRCCTSYRALLERLGVADRAELQRRMDIPVVSPGRPPARLRRTALPAPLHFGLSLARYPYLRTSDRLGVVRAALAMRRLDPRDPSLDRQTFAAWLARHHQSPRAVRYLWDLLALPTLNLPADQASLALAAKVFRTGLLDTNDGADVGVPLVPLQQLHGAPAASVLAEAGAEVRLGARAGSVAVHDEGLSVGLDDERIDGEAVILAVPHDRVRPLLPPAALPDPDGPGRLGLSPIVNVHVVYDRAVMRERFVAAVDSPVQWVFDRSAAAGLPAGSGQYLAISLSGAAEMADRPVEWFRQTFVPAMAALFPAAGSATVQRFVVTRERAATFHQSPGSAALRPGTRTGIPRLFLAGAWTDTGWPATMEGAVRSGIAAARQALLTVGRTERLPEEVAA